jgi:5-methyltetrahydrofolate--homocysteine methyltransferase
MPELHFTPRDWERVERDALAWWAGELARPLVWFTGTERRKPRERHTFLTNYPLTLSADELVAQYEPELLAQRYYGDAFPYAWLNFGPGMMAGFMGAEVHSVIEPSETVWFTPPNNAPPEGDFVRYDAGNPWLRRVQDVAAALVRRWGGQVVVGQCDLGGNLDVVASFRATQGLLFDLHDRPADVDRWVAETTRLWIRYYDEIDAILRPAGRGSSTWAPLWSPGKTYMLQSDFSYMISPAMFERWVLPDLVACCEHLDHGFYHLDGKGEIPHLEMLLGIERLRGIQWIPGDGAPPPQDWLPLLARIRQGGKLCQVFVSPEGALKIVRNLGGRGFLLVISHDGELDDPEDAAAFLKQLSRDDVKR